MILYAKIFLLSITVYLKILDIIYIALNKISLGDIANVLATVILGVLGYRYTKIQDKKIDNQNKIERLTKYQSIITVDNELNSNITLDIATWHNYKYISQFENVLLTDKELIDGMTYAFDLNIMLKCLSDTLPSKIRIKQIDMFDTHVDKKDEYKEQLILRFTNTNYEFKSLCFDNNKILQMTCLCCITDKEYKKLGEHDYSNKNINFQFVFEVENQFNIITEINLRAVFKIENLLDVGTSNFGGQKAQLKLKLIRSYSNIVNTYEE